MVPGIGKLTFVAMEVEVHVTQNIRINTYCKIRDSLSTEFLYESHEEWQLWFPV